MDYSVETLLHNQRVERERTRRALLKEIAELSNRVNKLNRELKTLDQSYPVPEAPDRE